MVHGAEHPPSRSLADVALDSDDEARRAAEAIIADVGSGEIAAAEDFVALYTDPNDVRRIGSYLVPTLSEAVARWSAGDVSPVTARIVAFARDLNDALEVLDTETAAAQPERGAERRAATVAAIQPAPGHRSSDDRDRPPRPAATRRRRS